MVWCRWSDGGCNDARLDDDDLEDVEDRVDRARCPTSGDAL